MIIFVRENQSQHKNVKKNNWNKTDWLPSERQQKDHVFSSGFSIPN